MRTILETDSEFICDIQAPCFQHLLPAEAEVVRASKTQPQGVITLFFWCSDQKADRADKS